MDDLVTRIVQSY